MLKFLFQLLLVDMMNMKNKKFDELHDQLKKKIKEKENKEKPKNTQQKTNKTERHKN